MKRWIFFTLLLLTACGRGVPRDAQIVVAGDSVMAWNRSAGASVAQGLEARLGVPVGDVSIPFARVAGGSGALNIPTQLDGVRAAWVVVNGGANDLRNACGCRGCGSTLDRLISDNGTQGAIPALVRDLRARGSRVVWADYYTSPRFARTICERPYQELEARLGRMADTDAGVFLVDMDEVFSPDDETLFDRDRLHPSAKGSARIVRQVAAVIWR